MTEKKQLKLGLFLFVPGNHLGGWRHPDAEPEGDMDFAHYLRQVQTAERGKFDTVFFQDTSSGVWRNEDAQRGRVVHLDPASLLPALAVATKHIGLIATATTTYNEPFHIARRFATIDHISKGRAGWNLVTSQVESEAQNFGFDAHLAHGDRYERAYEFYEVVAGLWDSWEEDAFRRDKVTGVYFDDDKAHVLDHKGKHFKVRGPLNVARTPQGRPVIAQAGSSGPGRDMAARSADIVFTAQTTLEDAQAFRADLRDRVKQYDRAPDSIKILPGLMPIVGRTEEEAQAKLEAIQALLPVNAIVGALERHSGGIDLSQHSPDGPLPELPPSNSAKGRQDLLVELARRHNWSIRQLANFVALAGGHLVVVGSAGKVADLMQDWFENGGADGFNLMFPFFPTPLDDFVDLVVPELQKRGIYRTEYEGKTLRENLGLPVPDNRYTAARSQSPEKETA
jgi:FMN-dependent oxidoreductase (nitrilotriacetate monooxygenase family)